MTRLRAALGAAALAALGAAAGCASGGGAATPPCAGLVPPGLVAAAAVALPGTWDTAHLGADVTNEVVVGPDGTLRSVRYLSSALELLAPFSKLSLERGRFSGGTLEGNPVAVRGDVTIFVGKANKPRTQPEPDRVRAFVPGGASREARWQLAGSVDRLAFDAHVRTSAPKGVSVVAVAPRGAEKTLLAAAPAPKPFDIRETVKTGSFLEAAGDYRIELRAEGKTLAFTTVTIAPGFETAIVNACAPLPAPKKTGPGY